MLCNKDIENYAIILTKQLNSRFSKHEWQNFAKEKGLPQNFSSFRKNGWFQTIKELSVWAANESGIEYVHEDQRVVKTYNKMIQQGYISKIEDGKVFVQKKCENSGKLFWVTHDHRNASYASVFDALEKRNSNSEFHKNRTAKTKKTYVLKSKKIKQDQVKIYSKLVFENNRQPLLKEWEDRCREEGVPFRLRTKNGFANFNNIKEAASNYNHKVVKIEHLEKRSDVYNITVDDNHTVGIINKVSKNKSGNEIFDGVFSFQCGEIPLPAGDSCRLLLTNLFKFVSNPFTKQASFDFKAFYQCAKTAQRLMDDLIDLEIESVMKIIDKIKKDPEDEFTKTRELKLWENILEICKKGRRTGTGLTALGDTLAALNISYGSKKGVDTVDRIYKTLKFAAYESSIEIAKEIGTFPVWDHELEKNNPYLNRIKEETLELDGIVISGKTLWDNMKKYGRRNIALLTSSPAGSVSLLALLTKYFGSSSAIEPQYALEYTKKKKININDKESRVDSVDQNGDKWTHFKIYPSAVKEWMDVTGKTNLEESPWHNNCALNLDWETRVKIQATAQKHIDHSISSTVNLPHDVSVDEVKKIYELAWKLGCKGITVYRDGCRTGVMVIDDSSKDSITKSQSPKRPKELPCDIYHTSVKGEEYFVAVGLYGCGKEPYEVFAGKNGTIPKKFKTGILKRVKRGAYSLILDDDHIINNIIEYEADEEEAMTRMISTNLRHGADISFIVHQLEKTKGELTSFSKSVARTLKKYIDDGQKVTGEECAECRGPLIRQDGCKICAACGWTACG